MLQHPVKDKSGNDTYELWALKNISLEIKRGEGVGIIGSNGSGKTTLLKILAGITAPTLGKAELYGRVASILDIGSGFHYELSGSENIFLNGQLHGFTRKEIKNRFEEIVSFSGIGKFIDEPVKNYSNGMYLRLAFSIMAHLDFDIYLFDEVMSVGDAEFTFKSKAKFQELISSEKTILSVSHNFNEIYDQDLFVLLENGTAKEITKKKNILLEYVEKNIGTGESEILTRSVEITDFTKFPLSKDVKIGKLHFFQENMTESELFRTDKPFILEIEYEKLRDNDTIDLVMCVSDQQGNMILSSSPFVSGDFSEKTERHKFSCRCVIPPDLFSAQIYKITLNFLKNTRKFLNDYKSDTITTSFDGGHSIENALRLPSIITFKPVFFKKNSPIDLSSINLPGHLLAAFDWK